jgi:hypothetical protein
MVCKISKIKKILALTKLAELAEAKGDPETAKKLWIMAKQVKNEYRTIHNQRTKPERGRHSSCKRYRA